MVRAQRGGEDVVIIVVTARDRPEDLHQVLDAGASDYLSKPIDPDLLRTRLTVASRQAEVARQRRAGKQALLRAEEAFQRLVQSAPDAVFVTTPSDVITYVNPRMLEFLGYASASALLGRKAADVVHMDDHNQLRLEKQEFLRKGQPSPPKELKYVATNGAIRLGETVAVPLDFGGQRSFLRMVRDITERTEMQTRLVLADRMASVGTLAAGVAHELNNPLAYVLSNLRLSREELNLPTTTERTELIKQQLDEAAHGARRIGDIVRDLKTFSRGADEPETNVDPSEVLASSINMCWNEIRHRARLEKYFAAVPHVSVCESRLGQVFVNILINAVQSMGEDDTSRNRIFIRAETDDEGWASIVIRDTGCGIASEHLGRVFDPFFTTKSVSEGSGLGLAICRNIISHAGGEIAVDSVEGDGTSVLVRLPPAKVVSPRVQSAPPLAPAAPNATARVLVVDDEALVGRSIRRALRGHDVQVLSSGKEAIQMLTDVQPPTHDVVFCDLMMPEFSGMDVFEAVQRARPDVAKRFVFMTGGAFTPRARRFLESTENEWLEKPFDISQIRAMVESRAR